jgi:hypothetical protein
MHLKHAVFELGGDLRAIGPIRKGEATKKIPVRAFDAMKFFVLLFLLELALTGDREHPVFDCDLHVLLLHFRQVSLHEPFLVRRATIAVAPRHLPMPSPFLHSRITDSFAATRVPACNDSRAFGSPKRGKPSPRNGKPVQAAPAKWVRENGLLRSALTTIPWSAARTG